MSAAELYRIWVVDDNRANLAMIAASFPAELAAWLEVRLFFNVQDFLAEHGRRSATLPDELPDFILLDFFLGSMYGWQVIDQLLAQYVAAHLSRRYRPIIIAHSSHPQASAMLVKRGADFTLPKIKGLPVSQAIQQNFCHLAALRQMLQTRRAFVELP